MCGVPVERADDYLQRLIGLGHRVAVCEQTEDPAEAKKRGPKSVVRRDVTRLVTPGTITEDRLLDPGRANLFLASPAAGSRTPPAAYGLAARRHLDRALLVERDRCGRPAGRDRPHRAARDPAAGADPRGSRTSPGSGASLRAAVTPPAPRGPRPGLGRAAAEGAISPSRPSTPSAPSAAPRSRRRAAPSTTSRRPSSTAGPCCSRRPARRRGAALAIDAATRANLELTRTLSGERAGSLLADDRLAPSRRAARGSSRSGLPGRSPTSPRSAPGTTRSRGLVEDRSDCASACAALLKRAPDIARALSRLGLGRGGPRDLACLRDGLFAARDLGSVLGRDGRPAGASSPPPAAASPPSTPASADDLAAALADDLPLVAARRRLRPRRLQPGARRGARAAAGFPPLHRRPFRPATPARPAAGPCGSSTTT